MRQRIKAEKVNAEALRAQDKGQLDKALELFLRAAGMDPHWSTPLYNAGLICKRQRRWHESLKYNQQAAAMDPKNQAAWWNLGIAATALGRWQVARAAWRGFGVKLPDGDGPVDLPCGFCPIRLNPAGAAEVVWAHRIDPARAILASIPFPESSHRWCDLVLTDGAPTGYRKYQGQEVPVFDALQLLQASEFGTYVARVKMPDNAESVRQLTELAADAGGNAEDWSTSVRMLCKACSEGRPHAEHDKQAQPADGTHIIAIAGRSREHAAGVLSTWKKDLADVEVEWIDEGLPAKS